MGSELRRCSYVGGAQLPPVGPRGLAHPGPSALVFSRPSGRRSQPWRVIHGGVRIAIKCAEWRRAYVKDGLLPERIGLSGAAREKQDAQVSYHWNSPKPRSPQVGTRRPAARLALSTVEERGTHDIRQGRLPSTGVTSRPRRLPRSWVPHREHVGRAVCGHPRRPPRSEHRRRLRPYLRQLRS